MDFLRRVLGGGPTGGANEGAGDGSRAGGTAASEPAVLDETERDRELLLEDARRLDDDLIQRQLRYADRAWTPPAQGGTTRAEDADHPGG